MKKKRAVILIAAGLMLCAGCRAMPVFCRSESCILSFFPICRKLVPFTDEIRDTFESRLGSIQFFISEEIVLSREIEYEAQSIGFRTHRIRISNEKKIVEIVIEKETRGILKAVEDDTLYVQFENFPDDKERLIPFRRVSLSEEGTEYPIRQVYRFGADRIVYEGNEYAVKFVAGDVPVREKHVSVYVEQPWKSDSKENEHVIKKPVYPILMVDTVGMIFREKEGRRATGVGLSR